MPRQPLHVDLANWYSVLEASLFTSKVWEQNGSEVTEVTQEHKSDLFQPT